MHFGNHLCPVTTTTIKIWNCSIAPKVLFCTLHSILSHFAAPRATAFYYYSSASSRIFIEMESDCGLLRLPFPHSIMSGDASMLLHVSILCLFFCVEKLLCRARQPASPHLEPSQPSGFTVRRPEVRAPRGGLWGGVTRPTPASQSARLLRPPGTEARSAAAAVKLQGTERAWRSAGSGHTRPSHGALGRLRPCRRPPGPPASADGPQRLPRQGPGRLPAALRAREGRRRRRRASADASPPGPCSAPRARPFPSARGRRYFPGSRGVGGGAAVSVRGETARAGPCCPRPRQTWPPAPGRWEGTS